MPPLIASSGVYKSATGFISTRYANAPSEFALKVGYTPNNSRRDPALPVPDCC
jgi:hypothetical protein